MDSEKERVPTIEGIRRGTQEGLQIVGYTTINFCLVGLFVGIGVYSDSPLIEYLSALPSAVFFFVGCGRPLHQSRTHLIKLTIGAFSCMFAGYASRWFFFVSGITGKSFVGISLLVALVIGYFTLVSRQSDVLWAVKQSEE